MRMEKIAIKQVSGLGVRVLLMAGLWRSIKRTVDVAIPFKNLTDESIERIKQGLTVG